MKVHLLTVGDEILIGQIVDTNSAWMARQLNLQGAEVVRIHSVGDDLADIKEALATALREADVVLMTGGLGPTKDDVTKRALAEFMDDELIFHPPTYERIQRIFKKLGRTTTEGHRRQAYMPGKADLLHNKMGTAPGMWMEKENKVIVSMPGIPYEMQYLMEHEVIPRLKARFPGRPIAHRTILTAGEGESRIAERLEDFETRLPSYMKLAYLPNLGQVRLRLTARGGEEAQIQKELDEKASELREELQDLVFGSEKETLEEVVGRMLRQRQLTVGTAESCTGGFLAHRITSVPGSSDYFEGAIVAYCNRLKRELLKVRSQTLEQHGAVSEATVREMAEGARKALGVDLAISVSGIAGPGGGTPEKPVGTIWMALADKQRVEARRVHAGKDRLKNIQYTAVQGLNFIRSFLLQHYELPEVKK